MRSELEITYKTPAQPRQLRLDTVGNKCNASCLSCHRFNSNREGEMPGSMIENILDDIFHWQTPLTEIVPVNYGEFFMRKDWFTILDAIQVTLPQTQIVLPTNGALLRLKDIPLLCSIRTLKIINFSINAYFAETYRWFTGLNPENVDKIKHLIVAIKKLRPDISIWVSMVNSPMYQTDLERDLFIKEWTGWAYPQILNAASAGRPDMIVSHHVKIPCRSIFSDMVVGFDGKLSSCCWDAGFNLDLSYYTGDLKKDWLNEQFTELRRRHNQHIRDTSGLCSGCTYA